MTPSEFWIRLAPLVVPLPEREQAAAVELAIDAVKDQVADPARDQDAVDEATFERARDELRARFERPLS
jgi:protein-tyrosine-phosphatase